MKGLRVNNVDYNSTLNWKDNKENRISSIKGFYGSERKKKERKLNKFKSKE